MSSMHIVGPHQSFYFILGWGFEFGKGRPFLLNGPMDTPNVVEADPVLSLSLQDGDQIPFTHITIIIGKFQFQTLKTLIRRITRVAKTQIKDKISLTTHFMSSFWSI